MARVNRVMGDPAYDRGRHKSSGKMIHMILLTMAILGEKTVILVAAGHGPYQRLWAVCDRSSQWHVLTGSWATSPTTGAVEIEREDDSYDTFDHGSFRVKSPSSWEHPALDHIGAYGPFAPVPLDCALRKGHGQRRL